MSPSVEERQRSRLARDVADFWTRNSGPSYDDVADVLNLFEIDAEQGSKSSVSAAIKQISREDVIPLVEELIELLRRDGVFEDSTAWVVDDYELAYREHLKRRKLEHLAESLAFYGIALLEDGKIRTDPGSLADVLTLPDEAVVRDHVQRLRWAMTEGDSALLLGSSKELLESTAKIVLAHVGETPQAKYPALIAQALQVLMLHPKSEPTQREDEIDPVRKILGGVLQIALEINNLRGERGTGHGRTEAPANLTSRHGRLTAGAAILVATLMFDTLDDESAPWRR